MFQVTDLMNDTPAARAAEKARFPTFADAADCASVHARQHGAAEVRYRHSGALLADFVRHPNGTVIVKGVLDGRAMVEEWAR